MKIGLPGLMPFDNPQVKLNVEQRARGRHCFPKQFALFLSYLFPNSWISTEEGFCWSGKEIKESCIVACRSTNYKTWINHPDYTHILSVKKINNNNNKNTRSHLGHRKALKKEVQHQLCYLDWHFATTADSTLERKVKHTSLGALITLAKLKNNLLMPLSWICSLLWSKKL